MVKRQMLLTKNRCRKCKSIIYLTAMGNYWCKKCNSRKDESEVRDDGRFSSGKRK